MSEKRENAYTAGPWHLDEDGWIVNEAEDFAICLIDGSREMHELDPLDQANARLIAAAPQMLEALKFFVLAIGGRVHSIDALKAVSQAEEVIALATGERENDSE